MEMELLTLGDPRVTGVERRCRVWGDAAASGLDNRWLDAGTFQRGPSFPDEGEQALECPGPEAVL